VIAIVAVIPLVSIAHAYEIRDKSFPRILDFGEFSSREFVTELDCGLERTDPPSGFESAVGRRVGKLILYPATYPGIRIDDPYPDWSDYSTLEFDCYSVCDTSFNLVVRIDDRYHNQEVNDRYNGSFLVAPGFNSVRIPLSEVRDAPASRTMDLRGIDAIHVFAFETTDTLIVYIDDLELK
jgi:hypothetical protein